MSDLLDEERKEAFLQTVLGLREDEGNDQEYYEDAVPQHEEITPGAPILNDIGRTDSNLTITPDYSKLHRRTSIRGDYG